MGRLTLKKGSPTLEGAGYANSSLGYSAARGLAVAALLKSPLPH